MAAPVRWVPACICWLMFFTPCRSAEVEIRELKDTYRSNNRNVPVERFEPAGEGKYPAIVMMHGSGGEGLSSQARAFASEGYVVLCPSFFEATGWKPSDKSASLQDVRGWIQAGSDAVTYAARLPNVDAKKIGLFGVSLGAYLAVAAAGQSPQVAAVAEYYGNFPDVLLRNIRRLPPTLILHGDADRVVSVDNARNLERFLQNRRVPYEIKIYAGQGHGFTGEESRDAQKRTLSFFAQHLKRAG